MISEQRHNLCSPTRRDLQATRLPNGLEIRLIRGSSRSVAVATDEQMRSLGMIVDKGESVVRVPSRVARMVGAIGDGARRPITFSGRKMPSSFDPAAAEELPAFECPPFPSLE